MVEQKQTVPASLLVPKPVPVWQGKTVRDALIYAVDSNNAAQQCEMDRAAIARTQQTP